MLKIHSTRLFPRNQGADRCRVTGIASRCDWVILTDRKTPRTHIHKNKPTGRPESIFLSLRAHKLALEFFATKVLPELDGQFTLITGSSDATIPNQIDARWPAMTSADQANIQTILKHKYLRHWAAENLDEIIDPVMTPLPVGLLFSDEPVVRDYVRTPAVPSLSSRPLRALCGHRVRDGAQWYIRKKVSDIAENDWNHWCTVLQEDVTEQAFIDMIHQYAFVICVEGGGLDPSPKAWLALLHGAIPIIRKSSLYDACRDLPVMFVDDWTSSLSEQELLACRDKLIPWFDEPDKRQEILRRLSIDYWWNKIMGLEVAH